MNYWKENVKYYRCDIVYYYNYYWICSNIHNSSLNNFPDFNNDNWIYIDSEFIYKIENSIKPQELTKQRRNAITIKPELKPESKTKDSFEFKPDSLFSNPFINISNPKPELIKPESKTTDSIFEFKSKKFKPELPESLFSNPFNFNFSSPKPTNTNTNTYLQNLENKIMKSQDSPNKICKKEQILLLKTNDFTKKILLEKYYEAENLLDKDNPKKNKWLNLILKFPFGKIKKINYNLQFIEKNLNETIYGQNEAKLNILKYFAKKNINPNSNGEILALCGPKGIGKTKLIRDGLAKSINLPFFQINCGGMSDVNILSGHDFTYVGSKPGRIIELIIESNCLNPIIFLDELDKVSETNKSNIYNLLIHLFDQQQNTHFQDSYFGNIDFDLSKVLFVASFNNKENIDPILLDRLNIVNLPSPNPKDKIEICKKMIDDLKIDIFGKKKDKCIEINYDLNFLETLIEMYKNESMRSIKKIIQNIIELKIYQKCYNKTIISIINLEKNDIPNNEKEEVYLSFYN